MRLYEINAALQAELDNAFDPETGEINPEAEARIDALEGERDHKALDLACYIKSLKIEEEAHRREAAAQRARAETTARKIEWAKDYLTMNGAGINIKDSRASVHWISTESIQVDEDADPTSAPAEYTRTRTDWNKTAIKEAIKAGQSIDHCRLVKKVSPVIK